MRILKDTQGQPKVSVILLDWGVRESFHSLDYLNNQDVTRNEYELVWIEFYDRVPQGLRDKVTELSTRNRPGLDQWIVLQAQPDIYFHKHFCYNVGIALSRGDICVICDSDVIFPSDFIRRIIQAHEHDPNIALHVDEIRNANPRFYPFTNPAAEDVIADGMTINWDGVITNGLREGADMLHEANYGACLAAQRRDLIAIGGADEHLDYLGYVCGPYDLTFRLVNFGHREIWLRDLFMIHTWHPGEGGDGNLGGPHDGRGMSLRALHAKAQGQVMSLTENSTIRAIRQGSLSTRDEVIQQLQTTDYSIWRRATAPLKRVEPPKLVKADINNHNIVLYDGTYYGFPTSLGPFLPERAVGGAYADLPQGTDVDQLVRRVLRVRRDNVPPSGLRHVMRRVMHRISSQIR